MKIDSWGFNRTKSIFEIGNILVRKKTAKFFLPKSKFVRKFRRIENSDFNFCQLEIALNT